MKLIAVENTSRGPDPTQGSGVVRATRWLAPSGSASGPPTRGWIERRLLPLKPATLDRLAHIAGSIKARSGV